jgi:hypothetical protein
VDIQEIVESIKEDLIANGEGVIVVNFADIIADLVCGQGTPEYEGMDDQDLLDTIRMYVQAYVELTEG